MGDEQVSINYELLYDMLRNEKAKFELQNVPQDFFSQVLRYLEHQMLEIQQSKYKHDLFSSTERSKQEVQLYNAKKLLRELYERRERKIMDMALNKSRNNSALVDVDALLPEERGFFETMVVLFNRYRDGVLNNVIQLKHPLIAMAEHSTILDADDFESEALHPSEIDKQFEHTQLYKEDVETKYFKEDAEELFEKKEILPIEKKKTIFDEIKNEVSEAKEGMAVSQSQENAQNFVTLSFLRSVERFVDEDLNYYGPFSLNDTAEIPKNIAAILIEHGKAKKA